MNEILKAMQERRSIRKYRAGLPDQELVNQVVEAGMWAANGKGLQNTKFLVVKNKELRDTLSRLNNRIGGWKEGFDPYYGAPIVIVVLDKKGTSHYQKDGCAAMSNMMLAAHTLGLGSCWINRAKEMFELEEGRLILNHLGLDPDVWEGVANLVLGYPHGDSPQAAQRKPDRVLVVE